MSLSSYAKPRISGQNERSEDAQQPLDQQLVRADLSANQPSCDVCGVYNDDPEYGVLWSHQRGGWICGDCMGVEAEE
jgi:hypothetical protein